MFRNHLKRNAPEMEWVRVLIAQMEWAIRNVNHNLDFIPDDKLNWKPASTALSALEIINHVAQPMLGATQVLGGGEMKEAQFAPATNREEAKALLQKCADAYVSRLRLLKPQDMGRTVTMPSGQASMIFAAMLPVVDLINHHGQITYIQSLLGDDEDHSVA